VASIPSGPTFWLAMSSAVLPVTTACALGSAPGGDGIALVSEAAEKRVTSGEHQLTGHDEQRDELRLVVHGGDGLVERRPARDRADEGGVSAHGQQRAHALHAALERRAHQRRAAALVLRVQQSAQALRALQHV